SIGVMEYWSDGLETPGVKPRAQGERLPARRAYSSEREKRFALRLIRLISSTPILQYSVTP
ncbi:MAG: hypothetical protein KAU38_04040, partial [Desulfobacterales bacterium]|nr:hypothetical protein [Desulfobacterales bacterium]